jgi:hypothetical protein
VVRNVRSGKDKLMSRKYSLGGHNIMPMPEDDSLHSGNVLPAQAADNPHPHIRGSVDVTDRVAMVMTKTLPPSPDLLVEALGNQKIRERNMALPAGVFEKLSGKPSSGGRSPDQSTGPSPFALVESGDEGS